MGARIVRTPPWWDWLPVVVLPVVLIVDAVVSGRPVTVGGVLAAVVACLPLLLRRRLSFVQLAPLLVAGIMLVIWRLHPASTVVLIPMLALYELARTGDRRRSLTIAVAVIPCVAISVLPFVSDAGNFASVLVRNVALALLAIAVGEIVRSRDEAIARAAAAHEEATLRRVGEERLHIAREVHDVVAHAMVAINVQAGVAAHLLERDPDNAHAALRRIKDTSGAALTELRSTLGVLRDPELRPPTHPAAGLLDVGELGAGLRAVGVEVTVELDPHGLGELPASVQTAGYRIVQEALTNVLRHGRAAAAQVRVRRQAAAVVIEVTDDGIGGVRGGVGGGPGHGVRGMRERATALGGTCESGPGPDGGWRVQATLPVAAATTRAPG